MDRLSLLLLLALLLALPHAPAAIKVADLHPSANQRTCVQIPLCQASLIGNLPRLRDVLQEADTLVDERDATQWTALHRAARAGQVGAVELLLGAGAALELRTDWGFSALHLASSYGQDGVVVALLRAGADAAARTDGEGIRGGKTALLLAKDGSAVAAAFAAHQAPKGDL